MTGESNFHVGRPNIGDRASLHGRFSGILDNQWLTNNGPFLQQFEDDIARYGAANHIPLVFDAAHAVGCTYGGRPIGNFGACEVFSFHATKVLNSIDGGAITTNDDALADRLRRLRNFGFPGDGRDVTVELGTNGKMNEFCAAMGLTNLEHLDSFIAVNKANSAAYGAGLAGLPGLELFEFDAAEKNNYQYVIVRVRESAFGRAPVRRSFW